MVGACAPTPREPCQCARPLGGPRWWRIVQAQQADGATDVAHPRKSWQRQHFASLKLGRETLCTTWRSTVGNGRGVGKPMSLGALAPAPRAKEHGLRHASSRSRDTGRATLAVERRRRNTCIDHDAAPLEFGTASRFRTEARGLPTHGVSCNVCVCVCSTPDVA